MKRSPLVIVFGVNVGASEQQALNAISPSHDCCRMQRRLAGKAARFQIRMPSKQQINNLVIPAGENRIMQRSHSEFISCVYVGATLNQKSAAGWPSTSCRPQQ